jgi:hypothetical protein
VKVRFVPGASSSQVFAPFGASAASEWAMAAAGCQACSAFAGFADRQNLNRSGPIAVVAWQLVRASDDSSW